MLSNHCNLYIFRQFVSAAVSGWLSVAAGLAFGFSAVLLPQLKEDKNFPYNDILGSWIASITPLSMAIGCICSGSLIDGLGRKFGHITLAVLSIVSWVLIALSNNVTLLLFGRFVAGLSVGSNRLVSLVYLGEISAPKYRSLVLVGPSLSLSMGVFISHLVGEYVTWRTSCFIYTVGNFSCFIFLLFLQESPLWLISKGKIDEGTKIFKWFRGTGSDAEKELNLVLQRHNEKTNKFTIKDFLNVGFIKPFITALLLCFSTQLNGVNIITFYAKDILSNTIKGGTDPFILMIVFDIVRLLTVILIFCSSKFVPRKIFFLTLNFSCCAVLFGLVIFLLSTVVSQLVWLSISLFILYVAFASCIVTLSWSFVPELYSGKLRGLGSGISASISYLILFACVKISPGLIVNYGMTAMYSGFCIIILINTILLCFLLPETNGRTLQDIEDSYKKKNILNSPL